MDYNPNNPLPIQEQEAIEKYFIVEEEYMATRGYSTENNDIVRRKAMQVIVKISKCENFDAFIPYLAMNYFDRYISRHPLKLHFQGRESYVNLDELILLAIGCLSLAWKMRSKSFSMTTFLEETKITNIDRLEILKAELMILNGLNWRMRTVTAMRFVDYFFNLIRPDQGFKRRTINEIIIQAQGDISFTKYKPSVIAASALIAASFFLYSEKFLDYIEIIDNDRHVNEDMYGCSPNMAHMCKMKKIVMESAEMDSREGPRLRVQALPDKPPKDKSSQSAPNEPPILSQLSQPAPNEPPMDKPSGSSSSTPHREGKTPMDEPSIPHREGKKPMDEPSIPRRKGKEPVDETSAIQQQPESEQGSQMNFALQWITNENEHLTIDFPRFRSVVSAEPGDVATTGPSRTHKGECCSLQ